MASPFSSIEAVLLFECPELASEAFNVSVRLNAVETVTERQNFSSEMITAAAFHF